MENEKCSECGCDLVPENTNHADDICDDCYEEENDDDSWEDE